MKSCFSHNILSYYFVQVLEEQKVHQFQCLAHVSDAQGTPETSWRGLLSLTATHFHAVNGLIRHTTQNVWLTNCGLSYVQLSTHICYSLKHQIILKPRSH